MANPESRIAVVGSINLDLVATVLKLPQLGETVSGETFQTISGGKGANQAVAAAGLGANVSMIGRVGDDAFGNLLKQNLFESGVDIDQVIETPNCSSGVALIGVEATGANAIVVVPGANGRLSIADVQSFQQTIASAKALIVQLETPIDTVAEAIRIAKAHGVTTILDPAPAPAQKLPKELLSVDIISPNQTEAEALTGIPVLDHQSAVKAAKALRSQGANDIVLKLGDLGALVYDRNDQIHEVPARKVNVVDSTAAGDAFTAAMTVALTEGKSLVEAARYGTLAGSLACTRFGAQPAMPTRQELVDFELHSK